MNRNYLIKEIKDLSDNFNDWQKERILELVSDHHHNTNKLKSLYDDLMKDAVSYTHLTLPTILRV